MTWSGITICAVWLHTDVSIGDALCPKKQKVRIHTEVIRLGLSFFRPRTLAVPAVGTLGMRAISDPAHLPIRLLSDGGG